MISEVANVFAEIIRMAIKSPDMKLKNWSEVVIREVQAKTYAGTE
jgi:hypothetical protein